MSEFITASSSEDRYPFDYHALYKPAQMLLARPGRPVAHRPTSGLGRPRTAKRPNMAQLGGRMVRLVRCFKAGLALALASLLMLPAPALAVPSSSCSPDLTVCSIYEDGSFFQPGFLFISGDLVLVDTSGQISDVLRFFNDFVDTGGGTGIGFTMFLYSDDEHNLPDPASFSVNAVFILEGPTIVGSFIETDYFSDGTLYQIFSNAPEPATLPLMGLAAIVMGLIIRRRSGQIGA